MMSSIQLSPYIYFKGNAKAAMEFYQTIFGGKLDLQLYKDVPNAFPDGIPEGGENRVMHAKLEGGAVTFFGTDSDKASDVAKKIELSLMGEDEVALRVIFDKLSEGGSVSMPLEKQFWGDIFGNVTDKYGVIWMIDIVAAQAS